MCNNSGGSACGVQLGKGANKGANDDARAQDEQDDCTQGGWFISER